MKDTRTLTEGAILAATFIILLLISMFIPIIGMITMWALPLPFVVYVVRRGLKAGGMLVIVACLLTFFVGGLATMPAAILFGSAGLVIGELHRRKLSGFSVLLGAGLIYTLNVVVLYLVFVLIVGENLMQMAIDLTIEQMELMESGLATFGQNGGQQVEQMMAMMDQMIYLAPMMLVGVGITLALISVILSVYVLRRLGHDVNGLPPFREWKFPKSFLWYYLIVLLLAFIGAEKGTTMYVMIWNLFPLLEIILTIQGFAFIFYYAHQKKLPKALPVILIFVVILITPLLNAVRILGIIDLGFDLRKRITSQKK